MKAIVYHGERNITLEDLPEPRLLKPDDVKVKVVFSGICGTDVNVYRGLFPALKGVVLGHEAVGYVVDRGAAATRFAIGERVVINPTFYCGHCDFCSKGQFNVCDNKKGTEVGIDYDGTHAEYAIIPAQFLHSIPDHISFEKAALTEPLACVMNNIGAADISIQDRVLILGGGPIGAIFAIVCRKLASSATIVEKSQKRCEILRRLGLNVIHTEDSKQDLANRVLDASGGKRPTVVVDAVGNLLESALELIEKRGRILVMGFNDKHLATISPLKLTNQAIKIIGAGDYNLDLQTALETLDQFPLEDIITHRASLEGYQEIFETICESQMSEGMLKVLLSVNEPAAPLTRNREHAHAAAI